MSMYSKVISSLCSTEYSKDKGDLFISDNQTKIHYFIDLHIHDYFIPSKRQEQAEKNYLQRAVLTKAFLHLKNGNIEEAEISFNNSLRFGQTNNDDHTIHQSLLNLIYIQYIKEDFKMMVNYLGNLFSLFNLDPYYLLCAYFYYIDVDSEINIEMYINDLKHNPQVDLNKIELVNHSYKDILTSLEESFFNKGLKKIDTLKNIQKVRNLVDLKLLDSVEVFDISASSIIFERVNTNLIENDYCAMILWKYLNKMVSDNTGYVLEQIQRNSFFMNDNAISDYYRVSLVLWLNLNLNAKDLFDNNKQILLTESQHFLNPLIRYNNEYLECMVMLKRNQYIQLKKKLLDKLKTLISIGYCKRVYFKFLRLLLITYIEIKDYRQARLLIDNNIEIAVSYNLNEFYYEFKVYDMLLNIKKMNYLKTERIASNIRYGVMRMSSEVKSLFFYTLTLLKVNKTRGVEKNSQAYTELMKDAQNNANHGLKYSLKIMDLEQCKKLLFMSSLIAKSLNNKLKAETTSKKFIQIENLQYFINDNYRSLGKINQQFPEFLSFYTRISQVLYQIAEN